mgnify:CR=1 FL=1
MFNKAILALLVSNSAALNCQNDSQCVKAHWSSHTCCQRTSGDTGGCGIICIHGNEDQDLDKGTNYMMSGFYLSSAKSPWGETKDICIGNKV